MERVSKYIKYFFLFFIIPVVIVLFGLIIIKSNFFRYKPAIILSGSMEPTLSIDDLVFTKESEEYKVGDIISYYDSNGQKIMHRIVEINGEDIITKGDANNTFDEAIKRNQVVGVYVSKIKYIGKPLRFIKSSMGITLFIIILILIVIFPNPKNKQKKNGNLESEKEEDEKITKIMFLEVFYSIFLIGLIIVGYYAKYQMSFEGNSDASVASWNNNIELLSEDTINFQNGQSNTKVIQFNLVYASDVAATYDLSLNNVSAKLGVELSDDIVAIGIKQYDNKFIIKINDVEESFDIGTLQTNQQLTSNNIEARYENRNNQAVYTFKDSVSGKTIEVTVNGNNCNYRFINHGNFQINDVSKRLYTLKISTLEDQIPNFDNIELYATFEQID